MSIHVYNTLTSKKEEFKPLDPGRVKMYVCGITPYDSVHLGHARAYVTFDIIHRHLIHSGYKVQYVQNFTDVDDKIIKRSREQGTLPSKLAQKYIDDYFAQMKKLNVLSATEYPRVTEKIPEIVKFTQRLIEKGFAYATPAGDVFFSVRNFKNYGKLSKRNLEELKSGARVEIDEQKKDPLDFALWKASKPDDPGEVSWDSPWGKGRPGWHIECSVMSTSSLGETIDIHGGGQDLIFPHHENEVAQSEAATGKRFARYWIHNGFVTVNREKMSKSLGNFFTLEEIFKKFEPRTVRYFLLTQHYATPIDFSDERLKQAKAALEGIDEACQKLSQMPFNETLPGHLHNLEPDIMTDRVNSFNEAMNDDFNTEKAISVIHEIRNDALATINTKSPETLSKYLNTIRFLMKDHLGIPVVDEVKPGDDVAVIKKEREEARRNRNWKLSDELRKRIEEFGYRVEDNPDGTSTLIKKS
ncbi:MAG: cysteine--tRNA ligase [Endomicrobiales bacterium]|nr:cysteine--tRNA ligase [Endomicrobiales bacterium]